MAQPNDHVKKHLQKRNVDAKDLPDSVINTLNTCSEQELKAMDKVAESFEQANVATALAFKTMH